VSATCISIALPFMSHSQPVECAIPGNLGSVLYGHSIDREQVDTSNTAGR
jgi:hypothetical protein